MSFLSVVFAQTENPIFGDQLDAITNPIEYLQTLFSSLIGLGLVAGGLIFFYILITGAVDWINAGGDKNKLTKARDKLTNAFIGVVILFSFFAAVDLAGCIFNTNFRTIYIGQYDIAFIGNPICPSGAGDGVSISPTPTPDFSGCTAPYQCMSNPGCGPDETLDCTGDCDTPSALCTNPSTQDCECCACLTPTPDPGNCGCDYFGGPICQPGFIECNPGFDPVCGTSPDGTCECECVPAEVGTCGCAWQDALPHCSINNDGGYNFCADGYLPTCTIDFETPDCECECILPEPTPDPEVAGTCNCSYDPNVDACTELENNCNTDDGYEAYCLTQMGFPACGCFCLQPPDVTPTPRPEDLGCTLTAHDPSSGAAPLNDVDMTVDWVSPGSPDGAVGIDCIYQEGDPLEADWSSEIITIDYYGSLTIPDVCNYPEPGFYTARAIIQIPGWGTDCTTTLGVGTVWLIGQVFRTAAGGGWAATPGIQVQAISNGIVVDTTISESDGTYSFFLSPGTYDIVACGEHNGTAYNYELSDFTINTPPPDLITEDLFLQEGSCSVAGTCVCNYDGGACQLSPSEDYCTVGHNANCILDVFNGTCSCDCTPNI